MFIIEIDHQREKVETVSHAEFNMEKKVGRIWLPTSRAPFYLKAYMREKDNSLKCTDISKNPAYQGAAYVGNLTGEDGNQKPFRFYLY